MHSSVGALPHSAFSRPSAAICLPVATAQIPRRPQSRFWTQTLPRAISPSPCREKLSRCHSGGSGRACGAVGARQAGTRKFAERTLRSRLLLRGKVPQAHGDWWAAAAPGRRGPRGRGSREGTIPRGTHEPPRSHGASREGGSRTVRVCWSRWSPAPAPSLQMEAQGPALHRHRPPLRLGPALPWPVRLQGLGLPAPPPAGAKGLAPTHLMGWSAELGVDFPKGPQPTSQSASILPCPGLPGAGGTQCLLMSPRGLPVLAPPAAPPAWLGAHPRRKPTGRGRGPGWAPSATWTRQATWGCDRYPSGASTPG